MVVAIPERDPVLLGKSFHASVELGEESPHVLILGNVRLQLLSKGEVWLRQIKGFAVGPVEISNHNIACGVFD